MATYESIKKVIDSRFLFDPELQETYNCLNQCLDAARENEGAWEQSDLHNLVFSEMDALESGEVSEDCDMWEEIRDIQQDIVSLYDPEI